MDMVVEYESLGELLAYFLFEIDELIIRYYVQPVEIDITTIDESGEKKAWIHIPDVLVFRKGNSPTLYQIKDTSYEPSRNFELLNKTCLEYAAKRNWSYKVIYPKEMPSIVTKNIKLLSSRTQKRSYYDTWIPEIIYRLKVQNNLTVMELATSFKTRINPMMILPIIYYLIAIGVFKVNMYKEVNQFSIVTIKTSHYEFNKLFLDDGEALNEI